MLSNETIEKLKSALLKMGIDLPATKVEAPVKLEDVVLKDETILSVDKQAVGAAATFTGADGVAIPAEGEYELADGSTIVCVAGLITEIKPAIEDKQPEENPMDALMARLTALESKLSDTTKVNSLETQLSETKKNLNLALEAIVKINENSVAINLESQKVVKAPLKFEEMTNFQKLKFNRGEL